MSYLWYSGGLLTDLDTYNGTCAQSDGMRTGKCVTFYNFQNWSLNCPILWKNLPETGTEIWLSEYTRIIGSMALTMAAAKADQSTILAKVQIEGNVVKGYASIGGTMTLVGAGTTSLATNTEHQIEMHYKRHATEGVLEVWVDGGLEISFAGNTGSSADLIGCAMWITPNANSVTWYISEWIATNQGRIGKKRMQLMYLSGAGDTNTTDGFMDVMGNDTTTTSTTVKTGTYMIPQAARVAGTLQTVSFALTAADTVKVGIFTKNATQVKFTPDVARQAFVSCLAGVNTLNAGNQIPAWNIAAGEYVGIYTTAGTLIYTATSNNGNDLNLASWYYLSGDAFALGTEQSYSTDGSGNFPRAFAQYLTATNIMHLFNGTSAALTEKPWLESKRYMSMSADGQEFLNHCTDLTDSECTAVNCLKVTVRGEAGTTLANGQMSAKIDGGMIYSDPIVMPTVVNRRHAYLQGTWTRQQINALQIGFKAKV